MATTNQKLTIDSQKPKRKELSDIQKNYQITKGKTKIRRTKKIPGNQGLKWQKVHIYQ